jgi:hypothetical protein
MAAPELFRSVEYVHVKAVRRLNGKLIAFQPDPWSTPTRIVSIRPAFLP